MDQKQFEASLHDVEIRLRRLKALYDQWLNGFERLEPTVPRNELDELIQRLKREQIRNTALRFRLQQVAQRYVMFITYWRRIARQMEEGTYQRDVLKARRLRERNAAGRESTSPDASYDVDVDMDLDSALQEAAHAADAAAASAKSVPPPTAPSGRPAPSVSAVSKLPEPEAGHDSLTLNVPAAAAQAARPTPSQRPEASRPPPIPPRATVASRSISPFALPLPPGTSTGARPAPPPVPPNASLKPAAPPAPQPSAAAANATANAVANTGQNGGNANLSNDDVKRIYAKYVAARASNSERVDNVRIESIEKSLRGMLPQLEKKHAGKKIDFEVIVKDGKVALKPVAK